MKNIVSILVFSLLLPKCYSQDSWKTLYEELIVTDPAFKACHASTIVETASGDLIAAFFAGSQEGAPDVSIWLAVKKKDDWEKPYQVADGVINDSLRYPCWNPVLFTAGDSILFLFYKVGPNPREWWGMVRTSLDNGSTWSKPERLPEGILGPIKNKPIQLADGTLLSPSSVETEKHWSVHIEKSTDTCKTWSRIAVDTSSAYNVIQPTILHYKDKGLQLLCRSDQDRIVSSWSQDEGNTWTPFSKLTLPNPNSGIDAVTLKNGLQMLVYNPTGRGKEWYNNRGKLNVAISKDGVRWKDVAVLENKDSAEFSYPAIIQTKDGRVHITYTYNRENIKHVVLVATKK